MLAFWLPKGAEQLYHHGATRVVLRKLQGSDFCEPLLSLCSDHATHDSQILGLGAWEFDLVQERLEVCVGLEVVVVKVGVVNVFRVRQPRHERRQFRIDTRRVVQVFWRLELRVIFVEMLVDAAVPKRAVLYMCPFNTLALALVGPLGDFGSAIVRCVVNRSEPTPRTAWS